MTESVTNVEIEINVPTLGSADSETVIQESGQKITINVGINNGTIPSVAEIVTLIQDAINDGTVTLISNVEELSTTLTAGTFTIPAATPAVPRSVTSPTDFAQNTTGTEITTPEDLLVNEYTSTDYEYQVNLHNIDDNGPVFSTPDANELQSATLSFTAGDPLIPGSNPPRYGTPERGGEAELGNIIFTNDANTDVTVTIDTSGSPTEITVEQSGQQLRSEQAVVTLRLKLLMR